MRVFALLVAMLCIPCYVRHHYSTVLRQALGSHVLNLNSSSEYYRIWAATEKDPISLKVKRLIVLVHKLFPSITFDILTFLTSTKGDLF